MIRRMVPFTLSRFTISKNSYEEQVKQWHTLGTIEQALSLSSGTQSSTNNILTSSSTHIAVTQSNTVKAGDKLTDRAAAEYTVDYAVPNGRMTMLYLKREQ